MKKIHIDENVTIRTNEEADAAFLTENDIAFYDKQKGITKVTKERWQKAQRTERKHWMTLGIGSNDDRNFYHADKFDNYSSIKSIVFKNALEVGCGPFTNMRLVGQYCNIKKCSLNDPLINDYLTHPNCSYSKIKLRLDNNKKGLLGKLFQNNIPIKKLYDCAFEHIKTDEKFDLIVIINVIEHCFDIDIFFEKVNSLLATNGILVFEDKLYDKEKIEKDIEIVYDAAHPLKVDQGIIKEFLSKNFDSKYSNTQSNRETIEDHQFEWNDLYFIGKKSS